MAKPCIFPALAGAGDVAADYLAVVDQDRCIPVLRAVGIVGDGVDVAFDGLSGVGRQIIVLRLLELIVAGEDVVELLGDFHLLGFRGRFADLPAKRLQERDAPVVGTGVDLGCGGRLSGGCSGCFPGFAKEEDQQQHHSHRDDEACQYLSFRDPCGHNHHMLPSVIFGWYSL